MLEENHYASYFKSSYENCREEFLNRINLMKSKGFMITQEALNVPSKTDNDLYIDTAHLKRGPENKNLLIISSAVHGIEGFTGSALQNILLDKLINDKKLIDDFDLFFIHGLNPWGFKHMRRVNENNVDLNRNFDITEELFSTKNQPYAGLNHLLNPKKKLSRSFLSAFILILKVIFKVITKSKRYLIEAIALGQYEFEKGIIFGGFKFQYEKIVLEPVIKEAVQGYSNIVSVDLHSGLGKRGEISLLNAPKSTNKMKEYTNLLFNNKMVPDDNENFYDEHGSFLDYISSLCSNEQLSIPVMFEFGTTNSDDLLESLRIIVRLRDENQGFHYGYKTEKDFKSIRKEVDEAITPSCEKWRQSVATTFIENIEQLQGINKLIYE
jgi:hypothetical protein